MKTESFLDAVAGVASTAVLSGVLLCGTSSGWAQTATASPLEVRIAQEVKAIHAAEAGSEPAARLGAMWGLLGSHYQDAMQARQAEKAYTNALSLLKKAPEARANYATVLDNLGSLYLQLGRLDEAETVRRRALEIRQEMRRETGNGLAAAMGEGHIAEVELSRHRFDAAARDARLALDGLAAADDPDASDRLAVMVTLTYALCSENRCDEGLQVAREGLAIARKGFQPDSLPMGQTLMALGYAEWRSRATGEAEASIRAGVAALRHCVASGSPVMLGALTEYRMFLKAERRETEMAAVDREIDGVRGTEPSACLLCTVSAYGLMPRRK